MALQGFIEVKAGFVPLQRGVRLTRRLSSESNLR